jgi:hypothetical protein
MSDRTAPDGTRFVCACCGKTSSTRYGFDGTADAGWNESCMMHAVLCRSTASPCTDADRRPQWIAVEE